MAPKTRQDGHKTAPRLLLAALGPLLAALGLLLAALRWLMVTLEPLLAALGSLLVPLGPLLVPLGPLLGRTRPAAPNLTRPVLKAFKSGRGSFAIYFSKQGISTALCIYLSLYLFIYRLPASSPQS